MSYPYVFGSPPRPMHPQVHYQNPLLQQRQTPQSLPPPVYRPQVGVRPPQQPYYPQYQIQNQIPPTNYGQSPVKPQSALKQSYPTQQQNLRIPNYPPQVYKQQQQIFTRPPVPQQQIPPQQRGIPQYHYQPQQQLLQKQQPQYQPQQQPQQQTQQQPQQQYQNKVAQPPKQSSQQYLPSQTKPQSHPSQHRPEQPNQQIPQQQQQQQINKPPQQFKQPQQSQKDDDLEKKFQDAIDRTRDLVQKYQNPQTKQPQQQQPQQQQQQQQQQQPQQQQQQQQQQQPQKQQNPQPKQDQHTNQPKGNDHQLQELALQYEDGYIYRGQGYEPATREGYGILTDQEDNTVYEGQWKDNQYHGQGKLINVQAEQIEGPFDYQDLSVIENGWLGYEGDFSDGKMNGFGRLQLTNGEVFEGQFQDGMIDGEGIFTAANGQTIKGLWKEGVLTQVFA